MSSLRKRVSSYFRQLSFHNDPKERRNNMNENSFVTKYLQGRIPFKEGPTVLYGKNPTDLPNYDLGVYIVGQENIVGCYTGPNGGLTTVKRTEKHLSVTDPDIDYIDTQEEIATVDTPTAVNSATKSPTKNETSLTDNTMMAIKVAGQTYYVANKKKQHNKSHSLANTDGDDNVLMNVNDHLLPDEWNVKSNYVYGLSDSLYDKNQVTKYKNGDPIADCFGIIARTDSTILALADGVNWGEKACIAAKSAIHGCLHYLNKTIFNDTKPFQNLIKNQNDSVQNIHDSNTSLTEHCINNTRELFVCLLRAFNCAHDLILENQGMLTTLTVAVVLPLNKSNNNKRLFEKYGKKPSSDQATNTENDEDAYVCCVCNVGDTLAYVYSQDYGIRELTKGSHDISSNRDMRDALGALGPVDGINPELNNLTLSITVLQKGDIVMIASDGLTDNFDPNVCKFGVNLPESKKKPTTPHSQQQHQHHHHHSQPHHHHHQHNTPHKEKIINYSHVQHKSHSPYTTDTRHTKSHDSSVTEKAKPPAKPPRKNIKSRDSSSRSSSERTTSDQDSIETSTNVKNYSDNNNEAFHDNKEEEDTSSINSALIAQFLQENPVENSSSSNSNEPKNSTLENKRSLPSHHKQASSPSQQHHQTQSKPRPQHQLQQKSAHSMPSNRKTPPPPLSTRSSVVIKSKTTKKVEKVEKDKSTPQRYTFLRSKTSLDMKTTKPILRNDDGIPFVTPIQRYELTLLLMEDILKRGLSGNETQCVTAKKLCENLLSFTFSITSAKRRTLEDSEFYYDNSNGILVEVSAQEKKIRRRRGLEKVQNLPGKLDHVSVVACNVGNTS